MSWFSKLMPSRIRTEGSAKRNVPEGLWEKCPSCAAVLYGPELERNIRVCPKCNHHMSIPARKRLESLFDPGTMSEIDANLAPFDALKFRDQKRYRDRLITAQRQTGEKDALISARGLLKGRTLIASAFEFASWAARWARSSVSASRALPSARSTNARPWSTSPPPAGRACRKGLFSLMQMAKTSAALARMRRAGVPFISVLTHPTTGGVSASLGMLGDLNLAEPQALIGFAGPRVIEQTVRETLPEGFQRSEFLLDKGAIDAIVDRRELRDKLSAMLAILQRQAPAAN
jgi:acetyl-CoA carboxylase carboxyl transferase subunit beta